MSEASLGNYFLAFFSWTNFKHLFAKSSSLCFLCSSHPFLHCEFQQKLLSVSLCSCYVCPGSPYPQKNKETGSNYFEPGIKFKRHSWRGKKDKVREGNNGRVLVSSGGSSFRSPAGLSWLISLWTLQQRRALRTHKDNSYTLTGNDFSFGNREKPNSKHPFSISLPPSILARKHILKSARPAGLWGLLLGKASVGTDSSLSFPGITAIFGRGLHYWEELLSSVTALVHTSFNASNSFTVMYICDYLTVLPAEVGLLSSLLYF